jgi:hypothetical protein
METPYLCVDTEDEQSVQAGVDWWLSLTGNGGEGMVVKPETYTAKQGYKLLQPAVKCRGREYLRIIYGAEYLEPDHLARLKTRSLNRKRTLALKEFSLGMESLTRFVKGEPLYRVHECSFGVLAFESKEYNKLTADRANEYSKVDEEYSTARDAVLTKYEEANKEWRICKAEDVDAFIKKCQAYNKEKKKEGLQLYCTINRKKDSSGFPYVDMGYCKCQVAD